MFVRLGALLLLAACAWASVWRTNFVIDRLLHRVGSDTIPLHDISFDVEHSGTFSGVVEFHLQKGTLGNMHRRVRIIKDCYVDDCTTFNSPHFWIRCHLELKNLVAKYNVEVITDAGSTWVVVEGLVDDGYVYIRLNSYLGDCSKCTDCYGFDLHSLSVKLKSPGVPLDLPQAVVEDFEKEVVSQATTEIARALNTTYKEALAEKVATLKPSDLIGYALWKYGH